MPHHLKYLEHEGMEIFSPDSKPNRKKVKKDESTLQFEEASKEKTKEELQEEYLDPINGNEEIWDSF